MYTVGELMVRDPVTIGEEDELSLANRLLDEHRIRHLPVVRDGKVVGLITYRDLLRCMSEGRSGACRARDVMTTPVATVAPQTSLREAIRLMLGNKYGCLPVVFDDVLVGIVTESDVVRFADRVLEDMDRQSLAAEYT